MQRNVCKIVEAPINAIALKARLDNTECGYLWKRTSTDSNSKWQLKWFVLYQNFLFYYENVNSTKPTGLIVLEGCYTTRNVSNSKNTSSGEIKLFCFTITYSKDGKNPIEFGAESEHECVQWLDAIKNCSYNKLASQNAELHEKYIHLSQLYETESKSKWQFMAQIEELSNEVKQLREELKKNQKQHHLLRTKTIADEESADLKRIKKVQSLCRGWLYRRRWKQIVKDYIQSPLALSLRKRNRLVFTLVEREGEYMCQLEILVTNFLRPFKMAACSNKPIVTHEEINCIFLNSEILLFLHQIFYKGLLKKLENWPAIFIGDLFDFLLPVLNIYQEYVRNHHYSLQILTELKSKSVDFKSLLKRYEDKPKCEGRTLDVFLTYPMHQIPRYILILHELLAHTSHNNTNERNSLENAKAKLEELSKVMHDEVSETENIRCNLAIEKMIVDGCDCLLDANQVFIREGLLILITTAKSKTLGGKIKDIKKRNVVKCFLFSNHLIITTRAPNGKLYLFKPYGVIALSDVKVVEDVNELTSVDDEGASITSDEISTFNGSIMSESTVSLFSNDNKQTNDSSIEFKILFTTKNSTNKHILFIASSLGEKQSWCSDISQCIDNINYSSVLHSTTTSSAVNMPNVAKHVVDPKLFKDDSDVKYCKTLNSCKVPQIRHASLDKLLERLTDLRFLSIDFLNTFLLTYRVFTNPYVVIEALMKLYRSSPVNSVDAQDHRPSFSHFLSPDVRVDLSNELSRRVSYTGTRLSSIDEERDIRLLHRHSHIGTLPAMMEISKLAEKQAEQEHQMNGYMNHMPDHHDIDIHSKIRKSLNLPISAETKLAPIASCETMEGLSSSSTSHLTLPHSQSSHFKETTRVKSNSISDITIHNTSIIDYSINIKTATSTREARKQSLKSQQAKASSADEYLLSDDSCLVTASNKENVPLIETTNKGLLKAELDAISFSSLSSSVSSVTSNNTNPWREVTEKVKDTKSPSLTVDSPCSSFPMSPTSTTTPTTAVSKRFKFNYSPSSPQLLLLVQQNAQKLTKRISDALTSPRLSLKTSENNSPVRKPSGNVTCGVVVTSGRTSRRRISNTDATKAFAVATSGSSACETPGSTETPIKPKTPPSETPINNTNTLFAPHPHRVDRINSAGAAIGYQKVNDWVIVNTAASMRVLNVLRHWVTKHAIDFHRDAKLKETALSFVEEMLSSNNLTSTEQKVANSIIQQLNMPESKRSNGCVNLSTLLAPPAVSGRVKFHDLSVSEIAEQMTYIDYQIFCSIQSEELLGQAWMKPDKETRAPNVLLFSKRFNEISQLVVTEIVTSATHSQRLEKLEKWITIANICRFLKNYNGVLQIMSAFASTSVFRLKKTWERLSKNNQQTIDLLQTLVSSDGRFKNLRDAMHKCDPPCIPYLGMYLMDLVFIEESTPDFADGLINFSKLRMISHIIREIRSFQHSKYTIHYNRRVCEFLADTCNLLSPDEAYNKSLTLEPRHSIVNTTMESDI